MCGIFGAVCADANRLNKEFVRHATDVSRHRGPDSSGIFLDDHCALGHRRLSIIDLSPGGHQPMAARGSELQITFNGEIYNFQELRAELETFGHGFYSRSDTEVILRAYEQWGEDCVTHLRGMFAFAIWDPRSRKLFLARDRAGKKPLFYCRVGNSFFFGSELQALLSHPGVPREPNPEGLDHYLAFGYVPAPLTAFKDIHKLPPAHWMTVDASTNDLRSRVQRYWQLSYAPKVSMSDAEAGAVLREMLLEAVRLRMISDVPLGAFLSGGIDSSIVVALMAQMSGTPVKTFCIGFEHSGFDEREYASAVAKKWETEHSEFVVKPDAPEILEMLVRHFGEPFADSSAIPTYYVSKLTREHVTVALSGDGGDENFGGYKRYLAFQKSVVASQFPGAQSLSRFLGRALPAGFQRPHPLYFAKRLFEFVGMAPELAYEHSVMPLEPQFRRRLLSQDFGKQLAPDGPSRWFGSLSASLAGVSGAEWPMAMDTLSYLPYDILTKVDTASMAASLECRAPFLDHHVMEFAASLPVQHKIHGSTLKYLLKKEFSDLLPEKIASRRKMGFGVPIGDWLRGPMRPLLDDALSIASVNSRGILNAAGVQQLLSEHQERKADHSNRVWALLMMEMWFRHVVESDLPATSTAPYTVADTDAPQTVTQAGKS